MAFHCFIIVSSASVIAIYTLDESLQFLQVNCIVFDKTGTLTVGKPVVVSTKLFKKMTIGAFYELFAAAEV